MSFRVRHLLILLFGLLIFFFLIFLLPKLVLRWAVNKARENFRVEFSCQKISANFFNLTISGLTLSSPEGVLFSSQTLSLRYNLISLLRKRGEIFLSLQGGKLRFRENVIQFNFDGRFSRKGEKFFLSAGEAKIESLSSSLPLNLDRLTLKFIGLEFPKPNRGKIEFLIPSLSFKDFNLNSSLITLSLSDTILFWRLNAESASLVSQVHLKAKDIQGDGFFSLLDTSYQLKLHASRITLHASRIRLHESQLMLRARGKGREKVQFELFATPKLKFEGEILSPFEKNRLLLIKRGELVDGGRFSFTGRIRGERGRCSFLLSDFSLPRDEFPFKEMVGKVSGEGRIEGSFDSLALNASFQISSLSYQKFSLERCFLLISSPNLFSARGKLTIKCLNLRWGNLPFQALSLSWDGKLLNLLLEKGPDTTLFLKAKVESGMRNFSPTQFSILGEELTLRLGRDSIYLSSPFTLNKVKDSLNLSFLFRLVSGELEGNLALIKNRPLSGSLVIKELELNKLTPLPISGLTNASIIFEDSVAKGEVLIKNFTLNGEEIGEIHFHCQGNLLRREEINLTSFTVRREGKESHLSGSIYLNKGKIEGWDIQATLNDPGPWVFSFLKKTIHLQEGKIFGKLRLRGNPKEPTFDGRVRIQNGKLFFPSLSLLVKEFGCELSLFQDEIILLEGRGRVDKGDIAGGGFVKLKTLTKVCTLHYRIEFNSLPWKISQDIFGLFSGTGSIDWTPEIPLKLSGHLLVKEALLTVPFGQKRGAPSPTTTGEIDFDVKVEGEKGIWLRNQNADLELGIDLRVKNEKKSLTLTGELVTRRGQLYYLDRTLQVKEGKILFENIGGIDPRLDLRGELVTKPIRIGNNPAQRITIVFLGQGTLSQPEFKLLSEPPLLSEKDIITYLTLNITPEEIGSLSEREIFYSMLQERLLSYFEREVGRKLRPYLTLDYLSFDQGLSGEGQRITVGKYLAKNFYLTYSAVVGKSERDEYKAEYFLTRRQAISAEKTSEGKYILKYQFQIRY